MLWVQPKITLHRKNYENGTYIKRKEYKLSPTLEQMRHWQ